ncbi:hypothetical protein IV55_GL001722 [Furfurilactobacillus siliginis]|uniref:HTH cro/C1-type domain-containing protein n=1 Tax=Furfurilactobacillus siliginis TaxID=348151 RepID=A0A0R2L2L5_9LACO|nr:hypothetical protein IV55_GL001722 [Furfurilactobacillus siliginis]
MLAYVRTSGITIKDISAAIHKSPNTISTKLHDPDRFTVAEVKLMTQKLHIPVRFFYE